LLSSKYHRAPHTLVAGTLRLDPEKWHNLALAFHGNEVQVNYDGRRVIAITDGDHASGMVAIGTDWGQAQFDNLSVVRGDAN
jgi:hypothetical protein